MGSSIPCSFIKEGGTRGEGQMDVAMKGERRVQTLISGYGWESGGYSGAHGVMMFVGVHLIVTHED